MAYPRDLPKCTKSDGRGHPEMAYTWDLPKCTKADDVLLLVTQDTILELAKVRRA